MAATRDRVVALAMSTPVHVERPDFDAVAADERTARSSRIRERSKNDTLTGAGADRHVFVAPPLSALLPAAARDPYRDSPSAELPILGRQSRPPRSTEVSYGILV